MVVARLVKAGDDSDGQNCGAVRVVAKTVGEGGDGGGDNARVVWW